MELYTGNGVLLVFNCFLVVLPARTLQVSNIHGLATSGALFGLCIYIYMYIYTRTYTYVYINIEIYIYKGR